MKIRIPPDAATLANSARSGRLMRLFAAGVMGVALAMPLAVPTTAAPISGNPVSVPQLTPALAARAIIQDKAQALGAAFTGKAVSSSVEAVPGGYRMRFQRCDIYYSPSTGAHEVHGRIRDAYNAYQTQLNGNIGLPATDQITTSDDRGDYSDLAGGASIYESPRTNPTLILGAIRAAWLANGAWRGGAGFPMFDEQALGGGAASMEFENDVLYWNGRAIQAPLTDGLTRPQLGPAVLKLLRASISSIFSEDSIPNTLRIDTVQADPSSIDNYYGPPGEEKFNYERAEKFVVHGADTTTGAGFSASLWLYFRAAQGSGQTGPATYLFAEYLATDSDAPQQESPLGYAFDKRLSVLQNNRQEILDLPTVVNWLGVKIMPDGALRIFFQPGNGDLAALAVQRELDGLAQ